MGYDIELVDADEDKCETPVTNIAQPTMDTTVDGEPPVATSRCLKKGTIWHHLDSVTLYQLVVSKMGCLLRQGDDVTMILSIYAHWSCMHAYTKAININSLYIGFHLESELLISLWVVVSFRKQFYIIYTYCTAHIQVYNRTCVFTQASVSL